jgi:hypothetical protein
MTCAMTHCNHDAVVELRVTPNGKWRLLCGCCAEFVTLFWYIGGQPVETRTVGGKAITHDDVIDAHDALAKMDRLEGILK